MPFPSHNGHKISVYSSNEPGVALLWCICGWEAEVPGEIVTRVGNDHWQNAPRAEVAYPSLSASRRATAQWATCDLCEGRTPQLVYWYDRGVDVMGVCRACDYQHRREGVTP